MSTVRLHHSGAASKRSHDSLPRESLIFHFGSSLLRDMFCCIGDVQMKEQGKGRARLMHPVETVWEALASLGPIAYR